MHQFISWLAELGLKWKYFIQTCKIPFTPTSCWNVWGRRFLTSVFYASLLSAMQIFTFLIIAFREWSASEGSQHSFLHPPPVPPFAPFSQPLTKSKTGPRHLSLAVFLPFTYLFFLLSVSGPLLPEEKQTKEAAATRASIGTQPQCDVIEGSALRRTNCFVSELTAWKMPHAVAKL